MDKIKAGIATFSHPMVYSSDAEREGFVRSEYEKMAGMLQNAGFETLDPIAATKPGDPLRFGIATNAQAEEAARWLANAGADCLVFNLNMWTNPHMCALLIKLTNVPSAIYVSGGINYPGETTAAAVFASVTESCKSPRCCVMLERFREGGEDELISWVKGCSAVTRLKRKRLLAWGGAYGANIPYTREDEALLEDTMVREIVFESEDYLTMAAKDIVANQPGRVEKFIEWLEDKGVSIEFDGVMLTEQSLRLQTGQYLAARDRLKAYEEENIAAVSVKCHFDVSTECLGCTECMIPAFLPFFEDSEGEQSIVPVACEGDLKGALTSAILFEIAPDTPPLFGDVVAHEDEYITISNCGASSVYWAGRGRDAGESLSKVRILPQLHGASGGAVKYLSAPGAVTAARLFRFKGSYFMYYGVGEIKATGYSKSTHGTHWPQSLVTFDIGHADIFNTIPCQHMVLTEGDVTAELTHYCRYLGIKPVRCDSVESLNAFREHIAYGE